MFARFQEQRTQARKRSPLPDETSFTHPPSSEPRVAPPPAVRDRAQVIRVGVAGVLRSTAHPGCVLLNRRQGREGTEALGDGSYGLPGGHLEYGELSFEDCLRRELLEETGLQLLDCDFGHVTNAVASDLRSRLCTPANSEEFHYVCVFLRGRVEGEPCNAEPEKSGGWEWHPWNALPGPLDLRLAQLVQCVEGFEPFPRS